MNIYFQMIATIPTTISKGVRKIEVEIMPDHMSYNDAVYDKENGMSMITNEQGYERAYDSKVARELFQEIYSKAIDFDYIMLFQKDPKTGRLEQIDSQQF